MKTVGSGDSAEKGRGATFLRIPFPWVITLLGALLLLCPTIYVYTFGVFFKPIAGEFGWSRAELAGAYAVRSLVCAVLAVPVGYWSDRYGPRRVLLAGFPLLGASMIATAAVSTIWQLYLVQGVAIGMAMAVPFVCVTSTVARWHDKRRGLALGVAAAGIGVGSIIFPPVATQLIHAFGWRPAIFILGLLILALAIPASLMMKAPDAPTKPPSSGGGANRGGLFEVWRSVPEFLRKPEFLAITLIFLLGNTVGILLLNHLVNYATDIGIAALTAAGMMSAMGVASTAGRLGMGFISDRIGTKADAAACCALLAVSFMLLVSREPALMWAAAVTFGVGFGGMIPLIPMIVGERVSGEQLARATGAATMGVYIGSALGPWLGGLIFDLTSSYFWALILSAGFSVVALILALCLPPAKR